MLVLPTTREAKPPNNTSSDAILPIFFPTQDCRDEALGLQNALARANSRLANLDALEDDARARAKEVKELQEERRKCDENLAEERGRTQHLVRIYSAWNGACVQP